MLKLPDLLGSAGDGVRGQALVGAIAAALTTWVAVKFLLRFFETNRLTPFGDLLHRRRHHLLPDLRLLRR